MVRDDATTRWYNKPILLDGAREGGQPSAEGDQCGLHRGRPCLQHQRFHVLFTVGKIRENHPAFQNVMRQFGLLATSRFRSQIQSGFTTLFFFLKKVRSVAPFSLKEFESRDGYLFRTFKIYSVLLIDSLVVSKTFEFFELLNVVIFNLDFYLLHRGCPRLHHQRFHVCASQRCGSGFSGVPGSVSGSKKAKMAQTKRNLSRK